MKIMESGSMKMIKFVAVSFAAAMALIGCQEEMMEDVGKAGSYHASMEAFGAATKTALGEGRQVVWSSDDRIAVFAGGGAGNAFQIDGSYVGDSIGEFTCVEGLSTDGHADEMAYTIAVYPFDTDLSVKSEGNDFYSISGITFPSEQTYADGTFADEAFPMVAMSPAGSSSLSFKNVGGVLKLSLTGTYSVSRISVASNDGELISGPATVTVGRSGIPSVRMSSAASSSVSLVCSPAVQLNDQTAVEFYISLPPTEFAGGFSLTVTDSEGVVRFNKTVKENNVLRSSVLVMPSIGLGSDHAVNQGIDYIDEYGINHGPGTKIGSVVWAPVNCGYHATDFQWGKLYQWGRKYGQGYSSEEDSYTDAVVPEIAYYAVTLNEGQDESNANVFFTGRTWYDWLSGHEPACWSDGVKSEYDPCPDGWRVPNYDECCQLMPLHIDEYLYAEHEGQYGWWLSGETPYSEGIPKVFLPAAGRRLNGGTASGRNSVFAYWTSSKPGWETATAFSTYSSSSYRACAYPVRCVQDNL